MKLKSLSVSLPFNLGSLSFEANEVEQRAAWKLYVELVTRVAAQPFMIEHGSLRGALSSLHSLFARTREILRDAGPDVAHGPGSFGAIAIRVLTQGIAPFTTEWHPALAEHEATRPEGVHPRAHEHSWPRYGEMVREFVSLQLEIRDYLRVLAAIADIGDLDL